MDRNKKVAVSMRAVAEMIKSHYGLPPDAQYQGSEYDAGKESVTVTFKHATFDLVKEPELVSEEPAGKINWPFEDSENG